MFEPVDDTGCHAAPNEVVKMRPTLFALVFSALALVGCPSAGVGDPCVPENGRADGFLQNETFLETSSVQCRTRLCMVYQVGATTPLDPRESREACNVRTGGSSECTSKPTEAEIEERVYCSCRCQAPAGSNTPTCECPDGFACEEDLVTLGGDGLRGGYCVRTSTVDN